ncbi:MULTISPECIES: alpha/beta hydrolase [unclassified Paenibacillus]|uniref:alpha/beta hydrolase n=1 Tax=unclassified Paenibacillus TaxID=185978 RepID=UPI00048DCE12|nr:MULTISPECIES: alpha/beta hydrolase [unclassified Paenibacillus]SFR23282.1 Lysophospholipase, alpha-beta hydrolase superfamily [Paenibacillus sp. cl130]
MTKKWQPDDFPVGLYELHPDASVNFHMNVFYNWTNDNVLLDEMREVGKIAHNYETLIKRFIELGDESLKKDAKLRAAFYFRGAEFFIPQSNSLKQTLRDQFIQLSKEAYGITDEQHYLIPYERGYLSAYRLSAENPKKTLVLFGGFDSYIEELFRMSMVFRDAGYDVIMFEGPGQGSVLETYNIPMTHEWEKTVKSLLDYFKVENVTLIGLTLGGNLVLRAAAYEPRAKKAVAYNILTDFYEAVTHQIPPSFRDKLNIMIDEGDSQTVNDTLAQLMKQSLMLEWALAQDMHVTGSKTPYDFLNGTKAYNANHFSHSVTQDVLLLAGQNDHYVPINQLTDQILTLTNVRSLSARMFTPHETSDTHCQIGNIGLALHVILNWMEQTD